MKTLRFLLFLLTAGMLFIGCQKELSEENGRALGNLPKDVLGNCQSPVINGNYVAGVALSPTTEYIALQINISQVGVYSIVSDTINGYYFSGTGVTGVTGINTVRLEARGTPTAVGTDVFNIKFDGTTCQINNIVTATPGGGGGGTAAVFTLGNTAGNCTSTPAGVYAQNFPTSTTLNYVDIGVTVTTAGTYNVTSTVVNGVKFSGSGNVSLTSTTIRLYADGGTPTAQGNTAYPLTVGTSTCSFSINYLAPLALANFTLNCGTPTLTGTYQIGTPMVSTPTGNTMTVTATVVGGAAGAYSITSNSPNGVSFTGAGLLTASAIPQTITLIASGTPTGIAGNVTYTLTATASSGNVVCTNATVPFTAAPVTSGGSIKAKIGSATAANTDFSANIIASNNTTNTNLLISGDGPGNEDIRIQVVSASGTPLVINTDYTVNQATSFIVLSADYTGILGVTYSADTDIVPQLTRPFTIRYSVITPNRLAGTFSGNVDNGFGGIQQIFGGVFDVTF
jgi:hypothetical protein